MGKIKLFQPGSLFISPVLHTQVFHKVDSNLRQPVLSPLKHFHTVTFSLFSLQMVRSLWIVIWSGLNLANSCDLLVESQFFQYHSFVTQTAVAGLLVCYFFITASWQWQLCISSVCTLAHPHMDCKLSYSVLVSSSVIDFVNLIVSPTLVVNQHVYFPLLKNPCFACYCMDSCSKPLCFCFSLPIANRCPFVTLLLDITC